jgi:hypothetical protein
VLAVSIRLSIVGARQQRIHESQESREDHLRQLAIRDSLLVGELLPVELVPVQVARIFEEVLPRCRRGRPNDDVIGVELPVEQTTKGTYTLLDESPGREVVSGRCRWNGLESSWPPRAACRWSMEISSRPGEV